MRIFSFFLGRERLAIDTGMDTEDVLESLESSRENKDLRFETISAKSIVCHASVHKTMRAGPIIPKLKLRLEEDSDGKAVLAGTFGLDHAATFIVAAFAAAVLAVVVLAILQHHRDTITAACVFFFGLVGLLYIDYRVGVEDFASMEAALRRIFDERWTE